MNNLIFFILVTVGLGVTTYAQKSEVDQREKFTLGVRAGLNYSNVWDEQGEDFAADPKFGFAGGFFAGIPVGKYLGVQPEVLLSQKGFQGSGTILGSTYSFSQTNTYIDVPLQIQIKPIEAVTLLVGPQFSFLTHEKNVYTFNGNTSDQEREFENDNIRKNIMGVTTGIDINLSHFVISGRACWDLQNNKGDGTSTTPRYKNQWVQFTLGFKL